MSIQFLIVFVWITLGIIIAACVTGVLILFYFLGKTSNRENTSKAFIFVDYGRFVSSPIKAIRDFSDKGNFKYKYKLNGENKTIILPSTYVQKFHKSRIQIYVEPNGSVIASPTHDSQPLTKEDRETLIHELVMSELLAQAIRAMKGKSVSMGIVIAIIICLIAGLGFGWFMGSHQSNQSSNNSTSTQQQTKQPVPTTQIEVK